MGVPRSVLDRYGAEVGILLCEDSDTGERWTVAGDPAIVRMLEQADPSEWVGYIESKKNFPFKRAGWPSTTA
jgi:hypothetical protein